MEITDAQFTEVITLSMPTPSWDPVFGTLGGVLDPKMVISRLNTEWNRRQGLAATGKDANMEKPISSAKIATRQATLKPGVGLKEVDRKVNIQIGSKERKAQTTIQ